jgi:hypothetical protein
LGKSFKRHHPKKNFHLILPINSSFFSSVVLVFELRAYNSTALFCVGFFQDRVSLFFFFSFFFYYSYVHTRIGSFLPTAPTPSLTPHSAPSLSPPNQAIKSVVIYYATIESKYISSLKIQQIIFRKISVVLCATGESLLTFRFVSCSYQLLSGCILSRILKNKILFTKR